MDTTDPIPELIPRRWLTVGAVLFVAGLAVNCASLNLERGVYESLQTQQRLQTAPLPPAQPLSNRADYDRYQRERAQLQAGEPLAAGGQSAAPPTAASTPASAPAASR